jgi:transposase
VALDEAGLSRDTLQLIAPLVATARALNEQLRVVETKIEQLSERQPVIKRLCTVPGVGPVVATTFAAVIDDANRFDNAHKVQAYLGLVPRETSSGGKQLLGHITKAGNSNLRSLLVQGAWAVMHGSNNHDNPLRVWAEQIRDRRGHKIAVTALARRLAGILWAVWKSDTVYDAARLAANSHRGLRLQLQDVALREQQMRAVAFKMRRHKYSWNNLQQRDLL